MRILTWNVAGRKGKLRAQFECCVGFEPDLVCLQEVTPTTLDAWRELLAGAGYGMVDPLDGHPDRSAITGRRRYLSIVAARGDLSKHPEPMCTPWKERAASASFSHECHVIGVHSVHLPAGAVDRLVGEHHKIEMFEYLTTYLNGRVGEMTVLAGDFNSPQAELADGRVMCWGGRLDRSGAIVPRRTERLRRQLVAEAGVLSHEATHGLADAYRTVHGNEHEGYSWVHRWRDKVTRRRFDHVLLSPGLRARAATYDLEGLEERLSDHAAMIVDFDSAG